MIDFSLTFFALISVLSRPPHPLKVQSYVNNRASNVTLCYY